ncbi:MAG: cytochrome c3 family protein [Deltaproteobacteria bacterium]|nr:cytochrome c3 family protein [Deltaproteobacteria bacterium]MBW1794234.1 cytochrome c3 family protein [Deltaproteobacteria bacterium]MBW2330136.1 cytochrome c3 family protein [Deltaproteobacteria bacterium]
MVASPWIAAQRVAAFSATLGLILSLILLIPDISSAKVTGPCSNCHTMHNSQGGSSMHTGYGADEGPYGTLLRTNGCVGCHASNDSAEWKNSLGAPIVYSASGASSNPLAGGNYYWVMNAGYGDAYGHNPFELGNTDGVLSAPPGGPGHEFQVRCSGGGGGPGAGARGCHGNRFLDYEDAEHDACIKGFHHQNEGGELTTANTIGNSFRGIWGVKGYEDPDWEQETTTTKHNRYSGATSPSETTCGGSCHAPIGWHGETPEYDTISGFCAACHGHFHQLDRNAYGQVEYGFGGTQSNGQWIRHPSDILLPQTGEYNGYPAYSAEAPVGYTDVSIPTRATAVVTCISCHRAHGSPYPDMLRWNYNDMNAGGGTNTSGCFTCHTEKDTGGS